MHYTSGAQGTAIDTNSRTEITTKDSESATERHAYLLESVLVRAGDVTPIPLREHEQALMPQDGEISRLGCEGHKVVNKRIDHLEVFSNKSIECRIKMGKNMEGV